MKKIVPFDRRKAMQASHPIMVVDDEQVVREAARRSLAAEGFQVSTAADAESALASMQTARPDIVIVDLKLPGMSGIELLEEARKAYPHLVVIVMTGFSSVDNAIASLKSGAFDFLPKPFTFGELLSMAHRACRYLTRRGTITEPPPDQALSEYHFLGVQTWARPLADGTALLGLTGLFLETAGRVERIVMPVDNDQLQQGGLLARITTEDQLVHVAWSPLSGRVLETHHDLEQRPGVLNQDPLIEGWIARIRPVNLEQELSQLRHVSAAA